MAEQKRHKLTDGEILKQSVSRPFMFAMLVDKHEKQFLKKSLQILRSKESAEDAVQEAFLKIYKNASKFEEKVGATFSSWAYKILINTCYDEVARKNRECVESYDFADLDTASYTETDYSGNSAYIESILNVMPKSLSRFLRMYFWDEMSHREIAFLEGMSETAVRSRIHRAKKYFKVVLLNI